MAKNTLAINEKYNLSPAFVGDSWSQFARNYGSATALIPKIPIGKYIEVSDKKFGGDSLVIMRRIDFDNLNMLSSMAYKISRCLMQIDRMTTTFKNVDRPENVIKLIHEEARMGIEFTVVPSTATSSDYFSSFSVDDDDYVMPESREDIEGS